MHTPKNISTPDLTHLKQELHTRVEHILTLFSWPHNTRPGITVRYIYDTHYHEAIAYTQFLVDTRISALDIIKLVPHNYTITLNYLELQDYTQPMQDFIIAHEIAHVLQMEKHATELIAIKLLSLPYSAGLGFALAVSSFMGASYATELFFIWFGIALLCNALVRSYEMQADKQAARALSTAQGGIDFMKEYTTQHKLLLSQWTNFFVYYLFATHPTPEQRALKLKSYQ